MDEGGDSDDVRSLKVPWIDIVLCGGLLMCQIKIKTSLAWQTWTLVLGLLHEGIVWVIGLREVPWKGIWFDRRGNGEVV